MRSASLACGALALAIVAAGAACGAFNGSAPPVLDGGDPPADADVEGRRDASDADADAGADRCIRATRCTGTPFLDEPFSQLPAGVWNASGAGPMLDPSVFVSPPSSLLASAEAMGGGGRLERIRAANGPRLCIELCARLAYDPATFGDAATDFVQLFAITFRNGDAGELRGGQFNLGLAQREYAFSDGAGPFTVSQLAPGALPRGRWAHLRVTLDYGPAPAFQMFVDGTSVLAGALSALPDGFSSVAVSVGAAGSGVHGGVEEWVDDLRVTGF